MDFKKYLPHVFGIGILLVVAAIFFAPNAFSGKVLNQGDNTKAGGMASEFRQYQEKEGQGTLWTNSAFGGMPTFQIASRAEGNLTEPFYRGLFLFSDYTTVWVQLFISMLCMYFLLSTLKTDWRVAVFGAIAYSITSYNVDILEAGHSTKMLALAMMPGLLASVVILCRGRFLLGGGLLALFTSMQIFVNHPQITYYTMMLVGLYFAFQLVEAAQNGLLVRWASAALIAASAIVLGVACNMSKIWPTWEYSKETIRGGSDLKQKESKGDGLETDYIFGWSCGKMESLSLLVPHYAGGGANEKFTQTKIYKMALQQGGREQANQIAAQYLYTGSQPFVGTAIYMGAIVFFLFFVGAFLVQGPQKWWLVTGGVFMLSLAWGKHFGLNFVWLDVLPMFKKFRAVTMALGIVQFCAAALAALGLQKLCDPDIALAAKKRALYIGGGITVTMLLFAYLMGGNGANDAEISGNAQVFDAVMSDRKSLISADVMRSFAFVAAAFGLLWLYLAGRLQAGLAVILVALLALADHWLVCNRTIDSSSYVSKKTFKAGVKKEPYDDQILRDNNPHYRVLDLARGSITGNANTSYYHKSLSGYHAAKLQRFQEVVDSVIAPNFSQAMPIIGMMNGKYIVTQQGQVVPNPTACGNAWFVKHYSVVPTAEAELNALKTLNPRDSAVIWEKYAAPLQGLQIQYDSTATIKLSKYHPDKMEYEYTCKTDQLAIFSEMYYSPERGWNCYLNGQLVPGGFIKANYLLRAMRLPAGQNQKLEMRFEPQTFFKGEKIAFAASLLTILAFIVGLVLYFKSGGTLHEPTQLADIEKADQTPTKVVPKKK